MPLHPLTFVYTDTDKDKVKRYSEPCRYWNYIHPSVLTSLQTGREGKGLNHHDEHLFIVVHQAFELWFKQVLFELDWIREALIRIIKTGAFPFDNPKQTIQLNSHEDVMEEYSQTSVLRLLVHRLQRADSIMRIATHGFSAMETMETMDFLEFRDYLIPASGFQSLQMRQLEIIFGIKDEERIFLNGQPYSVQFKTEVDDFSNELKKCLNNITLKEAIYSCIAHLNIPDRDAFTESFISQKEKEFTAKLNGFSFKASNLTRKLDKLDSIDQKKLWDQYSSSDDKKDLFDTLGIEYYQKERISELEAMENDIDASSKIVKKINEYIIDDKIVYNDIIDHVTNMKLSIEKDISITKEFFYSEDPVIDNNEKISNNQIKQYTIGQARRAALYLFSNPWTQPNWDQFECSDWSLFLSSLLKMEQAIAIWRGRHARMVELMIGRRTGTGGTTGVDYLDNTCEYRAYKDLWTIRAMLISTTSNEYKQKFK